MSQENERGGCIRFQREKRGNTSIAVHDLPINMQIFTILDLRRYLFSVLLSQCTHYYFIIIWWTYLPKTLSLSPFCYRADNTWHNVWRRGEKSHRECNLAIIWQQTQVVILSGRSSIDQYTCSKQPKTIPMKMTPPAKIKWKKATNININQTREGEEKQKNTTKQNRVTTVFVSSKMHTSTICRKQTETNQNAI